MAGNNFADAIRMKVMIEMVSRKDRLVSAVKNCKNELATLKTEAQDVKSIYAANINADDVADINSFIADLDAKINIL